MHPLPHPSSSPAARLERFLHSHCLCHLPFVSVLSSDSLTSALRRALTRHQTLLTHEAPPLPIPHPLLTLPVVKRSQLAGLKVDVNRKASVELATSLPACVAQHKPLTHASSLTAARLRSSDSAVLATDPSRRATTSPAVWDGTLVL